MLLTRISIVAVILIALAVILLVLAFGLFLTRVKAALIPIPQVGQMAPGFTLPSQEGTPVSLHQFLGQWVVLYFYPKDQTPGCTLEARHFQRDLSQYAAAHAVILGISVDSVKSHQSFCVKDGLHFTLLADQEKKVAADYGSLNNYMGFKIAKRNTFLINPEGMIVKEWIGVNPNHHSAEVLAALQELQKKN